MSLREMGQVSVAVQDSGGDDATGKGLDGQPDSEGHEKGSCLQHFVIYFMVLATAAGFLFLFSAFPYSYGDRIYLVLSNQYKYCMYALGVAVLFTLVLYISDVRFWSGCWKFVAWLLVLAAVAGYSIAALLATKVFVVAPIGLYLFGAPILFLILRAYVFKKIDILCYLQSLRNSLILVFLVSLGLWLAWIFIDDKWWAVETKVEFYNKMNCPNATDFIALLNNGITGATIGDIDFDNITAEELTMIDNALLGCTSAFILWLLPFVLCLWAFVFAAVLFFIIRTLQQAREATDKSKAMDPLAQAFIMFIGLGLFGMWAAAGIAAAEMSLTNIILALSFLAMMICGIVVVAVFGFGQIKESMANSPLGNRMIKALKSDWAKAMMLMLVSPFFVIYLSLSLFTQFSRRTFNCTKQLKEEDRKLVFTSRATRLLKQVSAWNWSSVFIKTIWLGILFFTFVVGVARITTLFLSWLNEQLVPIPLLYTTFIFIGVGITMFLLPPVPGVPVYVSGGIILVSSAEPSFGFAYAILFTMGICFMLKMLAIVIQQKVIGEMFSGFVSVRKFVGINSIEIRAIRDILLQPGMNIRKVSVLCGGPDWPVSVLSGILRLPLCSMLFGSLPVFFLISPCVLAGALLLKASEGGAWASLSTMTLTAAVVVQSGAMLAAIHFIAKNIIEKEEELSKLPPDQEVLELEVAQAEKAQIRYHVSHWNNLDGINRAYLVFASLCMTLSCYLFQLFGSRCFETFEVSDSIDEKLDGNALNLVKDLGWIGLALFAYPCVFLAIYGCLLSSKVSEVEGNLEVRRELARKAGDDPDEVGSSRSSGEMSSFVRQETGSEDLNEDTVRRATMWSILCRNFCVCCDKS